MYASSRTLFCFTLSGLSFSNASSMQWVHCSSSSSALSFSTNSSGNLRESHRYSDRILKQFSSLWR